MASQRASLAALAAFLVVAAAIAVIVALGRVTPPEVPALADEPDPAIAGTVAVLRGSEETCVDLVEAASGRARTLHCDDEHLTSLAWRDDATVQASGLAPGARERVLDIDVGGAVIEERHVAFDDRPRVADDLPVVEPEVAGEATERADGREVATQPDPPGVVVYDDDGRVVGRWETEEAIGYRIVEVSWSPDGQWILARDSANRLLVLDDRAKGARLLVDGAHAGAWRDVALHGGG